ncbi:sterol desaturase family protein [Thalassobius sp. I31.1]|uniref:sterol desaturase family protein n=1 Tax=Thalassobius sp. I31.1 TaxID=2109912 RepID=UPI000D19BC96|nr:sterol desaturase family protein [Thalassobius sp. I31.1]
MKFLTDLYAAFFGSGVMTAPEYLILSLPVAWIIYLLRRRPGGFWAWLMPRKIWLHQSHGLDIKLFVLGRLMSFFNVAARISLTTFIAINVGRMIGQEGPLISSSLLLTLLLWLSADLASYVSHRLHHQVHTLWPLHAVHHSAEVLTPFTAYRQHPLVHFTAILINSALIGVAQGFLIGGHDPASMIYSVAGINVLFVLANIAMSNFHHTHLWISFGPVLEHILISPAQHQIHHSTAPKHYNKNYGHTLAIWDWMFGTLYVIRGIEDVTFGVEDPQKDPSRSYSLLYTLIYPLKQMTGRLRK